MRVISGTYRSRKLKSLRELATRPTLDQVKEAVFNHLGKMQDKSFLDLFSGSGAIAIEAISRGAGKVIINDSSSWFTESYLLYFEEISHLLRLEKYSGAFREGDKFNCAAGIVEIYPLMEYILMLVSDEENAKALLLYLQETNPNTGNTRDILLKDFVD